eukprot:TRINITY_DN1815_c0_g1_i1.p1 TRINITY_DN1815_c0_g1~~TRINITY_DN1815_c0_g1_i1.p1  ORF type:complete len:171 (-),score=28.55 TRINITY_DN1815_c0_g1_i1:36-548(-)
MLKVNSYLTTLDLGGCYLDQSYITVLRNILSDNLTKSLGIPVSYGQLPLTTGIPFKFNIESGRLCGHLGHITISVNKTTNTLAMEPSFNSSISLLPSIESVLSVGNLNNLEYSHTGLSLGLDLSSSIVLKAEESICRINFKKNCFSWITYSKMRKAHWQLAMFDPATNDT